MQIVCSWCGKYLGDKEPLNDLSITGTICGDCYRSVKDKIEEPGEMDEEELVSRGEQDDKSRE